MIDTSRHTPIFNSNAFAMRRIDIIGAGATGSKVAMAIAKLGVLNIHVWDFDTIEAHNVANQIYGNNDIGKLKVDALREMILLQTGTTITTHNEAVNGTQELGDVVFLLTDTMASRKEIWEGGIKYKQRTKLMIETRMGPEMGRVYTINPCNSDEVEGWESTLCSDEVAMASACGASISVGLTADRLASEAGWQLLRWFALEEGTNTTDTLNHEIIFYMRPPTYMVRNFEG